MFVIQQNFDLERFVPKSYFMRKLRLRGNTYSNWKNRERWFKEKYFETIDCYLVDMNSFHLSDSIFFRYRNTLKFDSNSGGFLRFVDRKKDLELMLKSK